MGGPAVFVYDGYPGGVGLCRKGYELFEDLVATMGRVVRDSNVKRRPRLHPVAQVRVGNSADKAVAIRISGASEAGGCSPQARSVMPRSMWKRRRSSKPVVPVRLVFDLETQSRLGSRGGGSDRDMRLALAVTWDLDPNAWRTDSEEEAED